LDIAAEHERLLASMPSSLIVGGRDPIEVKLITSSRSNQALESGVDDDVELFNK